MDDTLLLIIKLVVAGGIIALGLWRWRIERRFMQRSHKTEMELIRKRHDLADAEAKIKSLENKKD